MLRRSERAGRAPDGRPSAVRQVALRLATSAMTLVYRAYRAHPALWRLAAQHYHPALEGVARLNAWMICQHAYLDVPAYRQFLTERRFRFRWWDLSSYPPTSKQDYVDRYPDEDRCWNGRIEIVGTVVDESSGSSGRPYNWLRSKGELRSVHKNVAAYLTMLFDSRRLFAVNAFSMGAWATGTNTGIAMAKVAMLKNTGPDLDKIVDTLRHFGPRFTYLVCAYPPFLKHLRDRLDEEGFDWAAYDVHGFVGGEALTEGLRDYLQERFRRVYSGYGASDLTIGMAAESDLSVWLRRSLLGDADLRREVLGPGETRTPMVFQYNPLETYLETTEDDELLVTLNSVDIMSPKVRYNIGDEARILSFREVRDLVARQRGPGGDLLAAFDRAFATQRMRLPFLLLFGRKDSTISYMGANLYPLDVENGLYLGNPHAAAIQSFKLSMVDVGEHEQRPAIHLQLRAGAALDESQREELRLCAAAGVLRHLAAVSRDVAKSLEEDPTAGDLRVVVHDQGTGPFADDSASIKNVYLVDRGDRGSAAVDPSPAPR